MIDMRKFIYIKAEPGNLAGYDLYAVRKCSCDKVTIVVGIPKGKNFIEFMPSGSYNMIKRVVPAEVRSYSQMFFVPRTEMARINL